MLTVALIMFCVVRARGWDHVDWAVGHGAYLHASLEYRDEGMYAVETVESGEILAKIPLSMEYKCEQCDGQNKCTTCSTDTLVHKLREETNPFWAPYIKSLETRCFNPLCMDRVESVLTQYGLDIIEKRWPTKVDNMTSAVQSRGWNSGMRPLLELFNHDRTASSPAVEGDEIVLRSNKRIESGEQAYDTYNTIGLFRSYIYYGFIPDEPSTCDDMVKLRVGLPEKRVECIRNVDSTVEDMIMEMLLAYQNDDLAMIKGAAQWLDDNIIIV